MLENASTQLGDVFNRVLPPNSRAELLKTLHQFAANNPKLAVGFLELSHAHNITNISLQSFLAAQIAISGLPLLFFSAFILTVAVFSVSVAVLLGIFTALLFTAAVTGLTFLVALPIMFLTTFSACFLFLWGLGSYYILEWVTKHGYPVDMRQAIAEKSKYFTQNRTMRLQSREPNESRNTTRFNEDRWPKDLRDGSDSSGLISAAYMASPDTDIHGGVDGDQVATPSARVLKTLSKTKGPTTNADAVTGAVINGAATTQPL
jgi:hypothetical protein